MKNTMRKAFFVSMVIAVGAVAPALRAATVVYNVDPVQSSIALSGIAFGLSYQPQVAGSNVDTWGGTITADLTAGVLTFTGGSNITANLNPLGPFSTAPGTQPAVGDNYGVTASGFVAGFGDAIVNGAYRNLSLDITAGTATNGAATAGMSLQFTGASVLDYGIYINGNPFQAASSTLNASGANTSAGLVSLTPTTLSIPVKFQTPGSNRLEIWQGTIVATLVPEPSSAVLGGLCGIAALLGGRRRK